MYLEYLGSPYPSTVASCFYVSSSRGDQTWTWCSVKLPSVRSSVPSTARVLISQKGPPEERLNGRLLFFDPSDSHPLTGLVPWTSATNAENCDWNYDACLSCWPIATPIHLSKHSRWSFFVALSHEEGVSRDFKSPNDFRWMCEPWYGDGDLLGAEKQFLRAPTHPKSGGLFPVPRGLH